MATKVFNTTTGVIVAVFTNQFDAIKFMKKEDPNCDFLDYDMFGK